ncbi:hypothetical protein U1Q18_022335, partial [Sarracenia purpurea var. burkii]
LWDRPTFIRLDRAVVERTFRLGSRSSGIDVPCGLVGLELDGMCPSGPERLCRLVWSSLSG